MGIDFRTVNEAMIGNRGVWHYSMETPIGQFSVVQTEKAGGEIIERKVFSGNYEKAERYYISLCKKILLGRI